MGHYSSNCAPWTAFEYWSSFSLDQANICSTHETALDFDWFEHWGTHKPQKNGPGVPTNQKTSSKIGDLASRAYPFVWLVYTPPQVFSLGFGGGCEKVLNEPCYSWMSWMMTAANRNSSSGKWQPIISTSMLHVARVFFKKGSQYTYYEYLFSGPAFAHTTRLRIIIGVPLL